MTKKDYSCDASVIDWPLGATAPNLYCPVTGKPIAFGQDAATGEDRLGEEPDYTEIESLLFIYLPELSDFVYIKDELREKLEAFKETLLAEDSEVDVDDEIEILQKNLRRFAECPQLIQMITSGMACGPVSYSVYFGFDLFAPYSKFYEEE